MRLLKLPFLALLIALGLGGQASGQVSFTSTTATTSWNAARWNNASDAPPYTSTFTANNSVSFTSGSYTFAGMGATVNVGNVTVASGVTVNFSSISSTYATGGMVRTINIGAAGLFDLAGNSFSTAAGTGLIKDGQGVFGTGAGTFSGGFTLNAGTVIARGTTGLGGGASNTLTLNGGTLASNGTRAFDNTRFGGGITVGGNVQFGELSTNVSLASSTANLSLANNVSLGATDRTLTLGNNGTQTLSGIVSGSAGVGITFAANAGTTGSFILSGTNTYTGATNVSAGRLLVNGNQVAATGAVTVANNATLGGSGTLGGAVTVQTGGTLFGGSGTDTGTLTTANATVEANGRLAVTLGTGTAASRLNTTAGILNLNTGAIIDPNGTFDGAGDRVLALLSSSAGGLVVGGTAFDTAGVIATYTHSGGTGVQPFGALQLDVTGLGLTDGDQLLLQRDATNQFVLSFTPVPEPTTVLGFAVAGLGLATLRARRRRA